MNLPEFYKSLYEHEMSVRNTYDSKIIFTFTLLSAIASLIVGTICTILEYDFEALKVHELVVLILTSIAILLFVGQLILCFKAYFSFNIGNAIKQDVR